MSAVLPQPGPKAGAIIAIAVVVLGGLLAVAIAQVLGLVSGNSLMHTPIEVTRNAGPTPPPPAPK